MEAVLAPPRVHLTTRVCVRTCTHAHTRILNSGLSNLESHWNYIQFVLVWGGSGYTLSHPIQRQRKPFRLLWFIFMFYHFSLLYLHCFCCCHCCD